MTTPVERFLSASFAERIAMVIDGTTADELRGYLGQDAFAEYRMLAAEFDEQHLAGVPPVNLLFLPGVMGSSLASRGLGGIWWLDLMNRGHIADLRLALDGASDADPRARVEPVAVMPSYEGFLAAVFATGASTTRRTRTTGASRCVPVRTGCATRSLHGRMCSAARSIWWRTAWAVCCCGPR